MKKLFVMILVVLLVLVACGKEAALETQEKVIESQEGIENVEVDKDQTEITTTDGTKVTVSNDMEESIAIPEAYPEDVLPVFDDAHIVAASENDDGSFMIMAATNEAFDEIVSYYEEILDGSEVTMQQTSADTYLNMGNLKEHGYTVTISKSMDESFGFENSFTLIIMEQIDMGETESEEVIVDEVVDMAPAELVIPDGVTWPENYPEDIIPAYDKAYTEVKMAVTQGDESMIGFMTEDKLDVVVDYYTDYLEGAGDFTKVEMSGTNMLSGTIDGLMITIMLTENDGSFGEDERFKTLIQIVY
ncbi:hypothetical protein EZV73_16205 [Acidaminobacter sp. JC074]|uniref:hypothetical protein n=1 Tax=Acidaminobacter sp. JC074 TaxID=2530199 RepID=UPI001F11215F|nr:hypothetical protein [Acidaminobacter sp. JC074]MCH4889139.1 hypothetical protein [Acidaminobacter sp. JC074]